MPQILDIPKDIFIHVIYPYLHWKTRYLLARGNRTLWREFYQSLAPLDLGYYILAIEFNDSLLLETLLDRSDDDLPLQLWLSLEKLLHIAYWEGKDYELFLTHKSLWRYSGRYRGSLPPRDYRDNYRSRLDKLLANPEKMISLSLRDQEDLLTGDIEYTLMVVEALADNGWIVDIISDIPKNIWYSNFRTIEESWRYLEANKG